MKNLLKNLKVGVLLSSTLFLFNCTNESAQEIQQKEVLTAADASTVKPETSNDTESKAVATTWKIKRYIFNRANGAGGAGHVGVGFELRSINPTAVYFYAGGVELWQQAYYVAPGGNNTGWAKYFATNAEMLNYMKNGPYSYNRYCFEKSFKDIYKYEVDATYNKLVAFPKRGYQLNGNNCMNATYDVLVSATFSNVPNPSNNIFNYLPNSWYTNICQNESNSAFNWSGNYNL